MATNPNYTGNNTYTDGICLNLQRQMLDLKRANAPEVRREPEYYGYLKAIQSAANKAGVEMLSVSPGNDGQINSVVVKYLQRAPSGETTTSHNTSCAAEVARKPKQEIVSLDQYLRTSNIIIPEGEMAKLCSGETSTWMARQMSALLDGYAKDINLKLMQIGVANLGVYADATSSKNFQVLNADGSSRPSGENAMRKALGKAGLVGTPIIVAEGKLWEYFQNQMIGSVQDTGYRIDQTAKFNLYTDWNVGHSTVFNDEDAFFIMEPGMVQLLTYNKYKGMYAYNMGERGDTEHSTFYDPETDLTYDFRLKYNECGDNGNSQWELQLSLNYDMWFLPSDAFESGDILSGSNFTYKGVATQAS